MSRALASFPVRVFAVSAALRVASFAVFYAGSWLTGHHGVVDPYDSVGIDHWAWYAAQQLRHGHLVNLAAYDKEGTWETGFTYLVAFQYAIFGRHTAIPRLLDALLAAFSAPAAYLAGRESALGEAVSRRGAWLVALWPLSIYWAGYDLIKDPLIWFLLAVGMLAITARGTRRAVLLIVASVGPMIFVRLYLAALLAVVLPLGRALRRDWSSVLAVVGAVLVMEGILGLAHHPLLGSPGVYRGNEAPVAAAHFAPGSIRAWFARVLGESSVTSIAGASTDALALVTAGGPPVWAGRVVIGLAISLTGPRFSLHDLLHPNLDVGTYPGVAVWLLLLPFTVLGFWRGIRLRDPGATGLAVFALAIWLAVAFLYAGGGYRQREMAFPATLLFTSLGLQRPWPPWWRWLYLGLAVAFAAATLGRELRFY
jgi:hypothetical protein